MCGCELGFVCSRCDGTTADPRRDHEPEPETPAERADRTPEGGGDD